MNETSNRYQASIEADATLPIIRMSRDFDATPAQLMRAHTDPELFARWVGPNGMETKILDWDATTGGRWRYVAGATARSTASTAASTRSAPTASSRPSPSTVSPTASRSSDRGSKTSAMAAPGSTPNHSSTASRAATNGSPAAWRPASTRATPSSTPSSPSSERHDPAGNEIGGGPSECERGSRKSGTPCGCRSSVL